MSKITIELQKDILNPKIETNTLLLKSYFIAKKLRLTEFQNWINNELAGYSQGTPIPKYREVVGTLYASIPGYCTIPVKINMNDSNAVLLIHELQLYPMSRSISNINSLLNSPDRSFETNFSLPKVADLIKYFPTADNFGLIVGTNYLEEILLLVRKQLLDWTIKLENHGFLGNDIEFTEKEKQSAQQSEIINHIINNIYHRDINSSQMQSGTYDSKQILMNETKKEDNNG